MRSKKKIACYQKADGKIGTQPIGLAQSRKHTFSRTKLVRPAGIIKPTGKNKARKIVMSYSRHPPQNHQEGRKTCYIGNFPKMTRLWSNIIGKHVVQVNVDGYGKKSSIKTSIIAKQRGVYID